MTLPATVTVATLKPDGRSALLPLVSTVQLVASPPVLAKTMVELIPVPVITVMGVAMSSSTGAMMAGGSLTVIITVAENEPIELVAVTV